jgi:Ca2+-binding RTX toxin-like protein
MATYQAFSGIRNNTSPSAIYALNGTEGTPTGNSVTYTDSNLPGTTLTLTGTGNTITGTPSASWDITGISASFNNVLLWSITGLSGVNGAPIGGTVDVNSIFQAVAFHNPGWLLFKGHDLIQGGPDLNTLVALGGNDTVVAGSGNDIIYSDGGHDLLTGGRGRDVFVLAAAIDPANNVDTIRGFNVTRDRIELDSHVFNKLTGTPELSANEFTVGKHAATSHAQMVYNPNNGALFYDPVGHHGPQELIALLHSHLALTASDFLVI